MSKSTKWRGPVPGFSHLQAFGTLLQSPLVAIESGEFTSAVKGKVLGIATIDGQIKGIYLSAGNRGAFASGEVAGSAISGEVFVNGESVTATRPQINSDGGGGQAATFTSGSGIQQGAVSGSGEVKAGDVLTYDIDITREAVPSLEIVTPCIIVDIAPKKND